MAAVTTCHEALACAYDAMAWPLPWSRSWRLTTCIARSRSCSSSPQNSGSSRTSATTHVCPFRDDTTSTFSRRLASSRPHSPRMTIRYRRASLADLIMRAPLPRSGVRLGRLSGPRCARGLRGELVAISTDHHATGNGRVGLLADAVPDRQPGLEPQVQPGDRRRLRATAFPGARQVLPVLDAGQGQRLLRVGVRADDQRQEL